MNWCKEEEHKKCKEIIYFNPNTKKKFSDQYGYYNIKSGKYYLGKIKERPDYTDNLLLLPFKFAIDVFSHGSFAESNFNTSSSNWNKKLNIPNFASFEAKTGEIIYIGDLYFTFTKQKFWMKGKANLEVKDNYNKAVKIFRGKHPEFKNKPIIKKLAKAGYLFENDKYDDGIFW
jgi:hypothetical protein